MAESKDGFIAETVGGGIGAAAGVGWFLAHNSIEHYRSIIYEAKGAGWALAGIVAIGGLASFIKSEYSQLSELFLAEDVNSAGGDQNDGN